MNSNSPLAALLKPVLPGLVRMREVLAAQVGDGSPAVRDMTDHVGRFQGKQLRGALVLLVGEATGNSTDEHATIAAIVEMIHLATLVHDDILDGAKVRRKVACVHSRWDNQVAVLLGDFLYARAFALSTELSSRLCSRLLSETTRRICVGEIEQSTRRYDFELAQERYEAIAGAKTATLYAAACELGARYPAGNEEVGAAMRAFGWELGLSFQIVDDCLDLTADEAELGKSAGTDVADGKVTLPVLWTYARADESLRAKIRDVYTRPGLEQRASRLREACDLKPGLDYAYARAEALIDSARARLARLPDGASRAALEALTGFVLARRS
ncbi:MAG TPA: polyprenyl synthetase family protein [Planctomycetota bacterium]|nr:polyprenyl synthetase family protein [Planctomycetota bacterium]